MKSLADIDCDYENCHAAWLWSVEHNKPDLIDAMIDSLYLYFHFHFLLDAGYRLFDLARQQWSLSSDNAMPIAGRLSVRFIGTEDPQIVQPILEQSLIIAEKQNQLAEIAFCQRELGRLFGHHSTEGKQKKLSGIDHLQTSLRLYKQLSDSYFEALILDDIGFAYLLIGEVDKRLEYSGQSLQIHRKIGNNFGYGDCLNGYALNMLARNMFDESFELMQQARELAYQTNNTYLLSMVTPTIGRIYMWKRNFEKAFETFQFGYRLSLVTKNERWRLTGQFGMASVLCMMDGDMDQVRQYLQDIPPAGSLI
jgi:tetratricopeptide (TPR) repeat protein